MKTIDEIRDELARTSARRSELWAALGRAPDRAAAAEAARLSRKIDELYEELRITKARQRSGPPELIRRRAERERRFERELNKALSQSAPPLRKAA